MKHKILMSIVLSGLLFGANSDLNGDGKSDFVWKKGEYYSTWYMNANGTHKYKYLGKARSVYKLAAVKDLNGDGKADFVWKKGEYYSTWYMNANGTHKYKYLGKARSVYKLVAVKDLNGDGKSDFVWKKGEYYSTWYMNSNGTHKYKYLGKARSVYKLVAVKDLNGDGKADFVWKKGEYYSTWYMNSNGTHKYKYLGKARSVYNMISSSLMEDTNPIVVSSSSKLFFNGNESTTTISKTMVAGSSIEGVNLGFRPTINMSAESQFTLKFKNGGFDVSNYYPVLCLNQTEVGGLISLGNSSNDITYSPIFQIAIDTTISKKSLLTFKQDTCDSDSQPITTSSNKDTTISIKVENGTSTQGIYISDYTTNNINIKVNVTDKLTDDLPDFGGKK